MRSALRDTSDPHASESSHDSASDPPSPSGSNAARTEKKDRAEPRNFFVMAAYQVVMRVGWIFKTESIIMPFVLDSLGGGGWLRGLLPVLNRFGQSVPPLMSAGLVKSLPQKKVLTRCLHLRHGAGVPGAGRDLGTVRWHPLVDAVGVSRSLRAVLRQYRHQSDVVSIRCRAS